MSSDDGSAPRFIRKTIISRWPCLKQSQYTQYKTLVWYLHYFNLWQLNFVGSGNKLKAPLYLRAVFN